MEYLSLLLEWWWLLLTGGVLTVWGAYTDFQEIRRKVPRHILFVAGAALIFVAQYLAFTEMQKQRDAAKSEALTERNRPANKQAREAAERAEAAELRAGEAKRDAELAKSEAQSLRLESQERRLADAPRRLSSEQDQIMVDHLNRCQTWKVTIRYNQSDYESAQYADQLVRAALRAHWEAKKEGQIGAELDPGLHFHGKDPEQIEKPSQVFLGALQHAGVSFSFLYHPSVPDDEVILIVGPKPSYPVGE